MKPKILIRGVISGDNRIKPKGMVKTEVVLVAKRKRAETGKRWNVKRIMSTGRK